jgi:hypothetical protein
MANKDGEQFLRQVRGIIADCNELPKEKIAHVVAFQILVMLDGSGEHDGESYRIVTENGNPVEFFHHELG